MAFEILQGNDYIDKLSHTVDAVEQFSQEHSNATVLLRGHFDSRWELKPTLGREYRHAGQSKCFSPADEREFVHRFIRHSYAHFGRTLSLWEAYTIQPDGSKALSQYAPDSFSPRDTDIVAMKRWRVHANQKPQLLRQLQRVNVNRRTVFPDLDGLAASIWQDEFSRVFDRFRTCAFHPAVEVHLSRF